ncbi:uncharacterized protein LOC135809698 isoform X2 [Sycon ciliatum]|uniref:uncharacterized protein LOC135809698 isoform X2 n=1 Tax=Sycon ciliatum TaxID=27933 RepID=UPI0031F640AC
MKALESWSVLSDRPAILMDLSISIKQRAVDVAASRDLLTAQQLTSIPNRSLDIAVVWESSTATASASGIFHSFAYETIVTVENAAACIPVAVLMVTAMLSLCMSVVNIATFLLYKELQTGSRKVLVASSAVDASIAVFQLVSLSSTAPGSSPECSIRPDAGFTAVLECLQLSSMLLNMAFVVRTYSTVVNGLLPLPYFTAVSTISSLCVPPMQALAKLPCYMSCDTILIAHSDQSSYHLLLALEPLRMLAILTVIVACVTMRSHITKQVTSGEGQYGTLRATKAAQSLQSKMRAFPLLFMAVNLPLVLKAWCAFAGYTLPPSSSPSAMLLALSYHGQSLGNFLLFTLRNNVVRRCFADLRQSPFTNTDANRTKPSVSPTIGVIPSHSRSVHGTGVLRGLHTPPQTDQYNCQVVLSRKREPECSVYFHTKPQVISEEKCSAP